MNDEIVNWIDEKDFINLCLCFAQRTKYDWELPSWLARWGEAMGYWRL